MSSLGAAAQTLAGGIIPSQLPEGSGSTTGNTSFTSGANTEAAETKLSIAMLINSRYWKLKVEVPETTYRKSLTCWSLSADIILANAVQGQDLTRNLAYSQSGLSPYGYKKWS